MNNRLSNESYWRRFFYRVSFILLVILGVAITTWLLSIPREPKIYPLLGIPYRRIIILGVSILFAGIWGSLLVLSYRNPTWFQKFDTRLRVRISTKNHWRLIILISTILVCFISLCLLALNYNSLYFLAPPPRQNINVFVYNVNQQWLNLKPTLALIQPLVILLLGMSAVITIFLPLILFGPTTVHRQLNQHNIFSITGLYIVLLGLLWAIGWQHPRIEPNYSFTGWYPLGAPIMDNQVLLALITGFGLIGLGIILPKLLQKKKTESTDLNRLTNRIDLIIGISIWILAAVHWLGVPTQPNWFVSEPRYPNFEYYPNSDALFYDATAQSVVVGAGLKSPDLDYPRRPMYAHFLVLLHSLVGQDYETITRVQAAIFALFPVLVYIIASTLHSRFSGLIAALLVILREGNSIALASRITVSNSRLIMSETPTAIGIALMICAMTVWVKRPRSRPWIALLVGAIIAATSLVRIEALLLLPLPILLIVALLRKDPRQIVLNAGLILIGSILFLLPWLWRNWHETGLIYLEKPGERLSFIFTRISSGEDRPSPDLPDELLGERAGGVRSENFIERFRSSYLNNQLQAALIFPDGYRLVDSLAGFSGHRDWEKFIEACCSKQDYINRLPFWMWRKWEATIPNQTLIPLLVNLLILSVGIVSIIRRSGFLGLFPLTVVITHYLISSAVRVSGGRFVQFVDWIWIVYFAAGLGEIMSWACAYLGLKIPDQFGAPMDLSSPPTLIVREGGGVYPTIGVAALILVMGASLPLVEFGIKPIYTQDTKMVWLDELARSKTFQEKHPKTALALNNLENENYLIIHGRALYPRYHSAMQGEPGYKVTPFTKKDFSRFSFYLVGPHDTAVLLPLYQFPVVDFPNASDVLVIGCQDQGFIRANIVYVRSTRAILVSSENIEQEGCQPPQ